ncbi:MAG: permease prefix domain 1-containing protein [Rhodospirillaceae bacterium]
MHQLEALALRLLRAGVGYRHVKRFVAELRDHHDDAMRAERARGASEEQARATALARLGDFDTLAQGMIARPELRAFGARYPKLWGGLAPAALWLVIISAVILVIAGIIIGCEAAGIARGGSPRFAAYQLPADIFFFAMTRAVPVAVGACMLAAAFRQRADLSGTLLGIAVLAAMAAASDAKMQFSLTPDVKGELSFGAGLSWDVALRAVTMLVLMLSPLLVRKRLTPPLA